MDPGISGGITGGNGNVGSVVGYDGPGVQIVTLVVCCKLEMCWRGTGSDVKGGADAGVGLGKWQADVDVRWHSSYGYVLGRCV